MPVAVAGPRPERGTVPALHLPVQDALLRTLAVLRFVVLLNTVVIYAVRFRHYEHPARGGW